MEMRIEWNGFMEMRVNNVAKLFDLSRHASVLNLIDYEKIILWRFMYEISLNNLQDYRSTYQISNINIHTIII